MLIICGIYAVLWGKSKETKKLNQLVPEHNLGDLQEPSIPFSEENDCKEDSKEGSFKGDKDVERGENHRG
jgi:hypothetical protein